MADEQQPEAIKEEKPSEVAEEKQEEQQSEVAAPEKPETPEGKEEPKGPPNIVTIEDAGPCKKKVLIEIPEEAIKIAADEQFTELHKGAEVPGFRKGRAPRRLLEKRFGKETSEQVKLKLLADASDSALKDNEIDVLREQLSALQKQLNDLAKSAKQIAYPLIDA